MCERFVRDAGRCVVWWLVLVLPAAAQVSGEALLLDVGNGQLVGLVTTSDGQTILITRCQVLRLEPPPPPVPAERVSWSAILYESGGGMSQAQNQVLSATITDAELARAVPVRLDVDAQTPDGDPLPLITAAANYLRQQYDLPAAAALPLPQVVGFSAAGRPLRAAALPASVDQLRTLLGTWHD